ncbi:integrase family protein [Bacteroides coprosuis DSM 18011]|uniref:Integrase family protein n=1 Tax=Bacteroides coprosuis DSM 18011 TaxID=679937 RepID=F3ZNF1_9BACE|nr:site-specific integrase [Bacteroides coprosuis]EGJ71491.1 integrase family protein [Bacteroides coprosuis DSM 18011]
MKSTFSVIFYLRRDRKKSDGTCPVMCRITIDGIDTRFNTKLHVQLSKWDVNANKVSGINPESRNLNARLDDIKASLHRIYHDLQRFDIVTPEKIKGEFLGLDESGETILKLFDKHNEDVASMVGISKSAATLQKYNVTRKHVANFIKKKYRVSDMAVKSINDMFLRDFEVYLLTQERVSHNTMAKFMQFFKRIIILARNNGLIVHDPFANYKIQLKKVDRGYLTEQEMNKIIQKKFPTKRLEQVRDIFIFSCFTGLAYIDVKELTKNHIRISFDGNIWIMTKRHKTKVNVNVPLMDIPKKILQKYEGELPDDKILPVLSNQKMNAYLKEIADVCGINKNLTFHLARHTFATTVTLAKGIPIETVSKMLGHTNIQTTQIYARITNEKISKDMRGLSAKFNDSEKLFG